MYLLDSNVFIQAKNFYYAFDVVPAFWSWLEDRHRRQRIFTVQAVLDELLDREDELSAWIKNQPESFTLGVTAEDQPALRQLAQWANSQNFTAAAVQEFLGAADYFLVAQATRLGYTVVSHETRPDLLAKKRIMIPTACDALGVTCVDIFAVLRSEGARFAS